MPRVLNTDNNINSYSGVILPKSSLCTLGGLHREHSPANFLSDYIENKTTSGGSQFKLSMYNNSFTDLIKINASNVYPTTSDLNVLICNQPKTKFRVRTELMPVCKDGQ